MATVSHAGFRALCEHFGGWDLYFSEMIDAGSLAAGGPFEAYYQQTAPCPDKLIFQLVGAHAEGLVKAAEILSPLDFRGIDINMGCSAPHIFRKGAGISWMKDPLGAAQLIARLRPRVKGSLSIKCRLGETEDPEALVNWARAMAQEGLDFITLHPRLRKDSLSRPSRWSFVKLLAEELKIPVYGNGDLKKFSDLVNRERQTPAAGYMVGRRAVAAPWLARLWKAKLQDPQAVLRVDAREVTEVFHRNLEDYQPKEFWPTRSQRFYAYFAQNFLFGHSLAARVYQTKDYTQIRKTVEAYLDLHPEETLRTETE